MGEETGGGTPPISEDRKADAERAAREAQEARGATPEDARIRGSRSPARGESKDRRLAERGETK